MAYDRTKDKPNKPNKKVVIFNGKEWTKESIKDLLKRSDKAVERGILRIYSFQTDEEKYVGMTKTVNGKGFNKFDVEILTSYAEQIKEGRHLTLKQMYVARPKICKYAGQLLEYIRSRAEAEEYLAK